MEINENSRRYYFAIDSKRIFVISILVIVSTIIGVWQFGIGQHRTLYFNSLISTTIISILFFLFITIGLYKGITLKDNTNDFAEKISSKHIPDLTNSLDFCNLVFWCCTLGLRFCFCHNFILVVLQSV
jgi:hypothetical protein